MKKRLNGLLALMMSAVMMLTVIGMIPIKVNAQVTEKEFEKAYTVSVYQKVYDAKTNEDYNMILKSYSFRREDLDTCCVEFPFDFGGEGLMYDIKKVVVVSNDVETDITDKVKNGVTINKDFLLKYSEPKEYEDGSRRAQNININVYYEFKNFNISIKSTDGTVRKDVTVNCANFENIATDDHNYYCDLYLDGKLIEESACGNIGFTKKQYEEIFAGKELEVVQIASYENWAYSGYPCTMYMGEQDLEEYLEANQVEGSYSDGEKYYSYGEDVCNRLTISNFIRRNFREKKVLDLNEFEELKKDYKKITKYNLWEFSSSGGVSTDTSNKWADRKTAVSGSTIDVQSVSGYNYLVEPVYASIDYEIDYTYCDDTSKLAVLKTSVDDAEKTDAVFGDDYKFTVCYFDGEKTFIYPDGNSTLVTYKDLWDIIKTIGDFDAPNMAITLEKKSEDTSGDDPNKEEPGDIIAPSVPKKGDVIKSTSGDSYTVTSEGKEVSFKASTSKKATVTVPATVKIDGVTYKVTSISANAFKKCKNVTKVVIGSNVTKIANNSFKGLKKLKTIQVKSKKLNAKGLGKKAFAGVSKKVTVKVPKSCLKAYKKLFVKKGLSKKVKIKK